MKSPEELKRIVKDKYASIAEASTGGVASCCGPTSCCGDGTTYSIMADDYGEREGYVAHADLGLGCGIPTDAAELRSGMTVLDLGSGAGNDVFIAAREVSPGGFVIGVDMTEAMIAKAESNRRTLGLGNVEFRLGDIESLPVEDESIDVVISNCVLNLVPDKSKAFSEIHRVLKRGGRFAVSDIVVEGDMPEALKSVAELYAGCVSGALRKDEYLSCIHDAGFELVKITKEKEIIIPEAVLGDALSMLPEEQRQQVQLRLLSITVRGEKT